MTLTWTTGIELSQGKMDWAREGSISSFSFVQTYSFPEETLKKKDKDRENWSNDSQSSHLEKSH